MNKVCKCCLSRNSWSIGAGNYGLLRRRDDGSGVVSGTRNLGENVITIGSGVPGTADTLSDFTGVNLRTLDIALLMCYDEKQFLPWSCCLASCCYSPMRQPCGPGKARSSCAPSQFAGACKPKIPIGGMWKYQLDLVGLKEWDCGLVYYAVHPYVEGTGRKSLVWLMPVYESA